MTRPERERPCPPARSFAVAATMLPENDHPLGVYDGQPVMEGHHGRLVYNCEPESADGCLIAVPPDFLGMPRLAPEIDQAEIEPEAGS
jgi:hypothetical protein